ncbi:uncharacterized protein LOC142981069 [Anticarsia gemmatalis]|uniref:uncharacterized protein LOC142981069 n=1 Tax=Anticarsia gemmatalis TaxID=129554 RepID=UPI003F770186
MLSSRSLLVMCLVIGVTIAKNNTRESIGFPEAEEDANLSNKDNRQPVYIPAMCPVNELFYPGDQKDDWICDCRPAYLYHPRSDACWPAYRKGPCDEGQYLVLQKDSAIPVCEKNPCTADNFVQYQGRCEKLATIEPCRHLWPIPAALAVNSTSLIVNCERLNFESRFGDPVKPSLNSVQCPPGCKRSINGKCTPSTS